MCLSSTRELGRDSLESLGDVLQSPYPTTWRLLLRTRRWGIGCLGFKVPNLFPSHQKLQNALSNVVPRKQVSSISAVLTGSFCERSPSLTRQQHFPLQLALEEGVLAPFSDKNLLLSSWLAFALASPSAGLDSTGRDSPATTRNSLCNLWHQNEHTRLSRQGSCLHLKKRKKWSLEKRFLRSVLVSVPSTLPG